MAPSQWHQQEMKGYLLEVTPLLCLLLRILWVDYYDCVVCGVADSCSIVITHSRLPYSPSSMWRGLER